MNISASKFSSGCESGWTVYLDQSYASQRERQSDGIALVSQEDEEEDLSMVSDASSGPPNYHEDDREECLSSGSYWVPNRSAKNKEREIKTKKKSSNNNKRNIVKCESENYHSCLDDTASSPLSKNKSILSRKEANSQGGFSATHFKGGSGFDNHFGVFESSFAKGSPSQKPGQFPGGNNW